MSARGHALCVAGQSPAHSGYNLPSMAGFGYNLAATLVRCHGTDVDLSETQEEKPKEVMLNVQ